MGFDLDTLELLSYINDLQVKLRNGSCSFSELKEPNFDNLFIYDDSKSFLEDPEDDGKYLYKKIEKYEDLQGKFEREKVILPYGAIIDLICEYFEYYIENEDDWEINHLAEDLAKEGLRLYGQILNSLWW